MATLYSAMTTTMIASLTLRATEAESPALRLALSDGSVSSTRDPFIDAVDEGIATATERASLVPPPVELCETPLISYEPASLPRRMM